MNRSIAATHGIHFAVSPSSVRRTAIDAFHVALVALVIAGIDMTACMIYWQMHGVGPVAVLRAVAGWVLGPRPPATAAVLATGVAVHYLIYLSIVTVFRCTLARRDGTSLLISGVYAVMAYVTVYLVLVPLLVFPQHLDRSPQWVTACVLLHGVVLGPLMAWLFWRLRTPSSPRAARVS